MDTFCENLAHFIHGAAFMFFILASIQLYPLRHRSNMMRLLFCSMIFLAFLEFKDMGFLIKGVWYNPYITSITMSTDMLYVPLMALFFFEVISPGWVTLRRIIGMSMPSVLFIVAYIIYPSSVIFKAAMLYALVFGTIITVIVFMASSRRDNYIKNNFSDIENLSISWVRKAITALYICLVLWTILLWEENWLNDAAYYAISIIVWTYIYRLSQKHSVIEMPSTSRLFMPKPEQKGSHEIQNFPFKKLQEYMEKERMFLNPKLTLTEVATAIGTNRTYLSEYLNNDLDTTFYEYVNGYRIKEACALLSSDERRTLMEIAELSGFNSLSTFNRAFVKSIGETPARYLKKRQIKC